jgi:hypothetical protein
VVPAYDPRTSKIVRRLHLDDTAGVPCVLTSRREIKWREKDRSFQLRRFRVHRTSSILAAGLALFVSGNASANLIVNGGFEDGLTGWTSSGNVSAEAALPDSPPYEGTKIAVLGGMDGDSASLTQTVVLPGPGTYTFGAAFTFCTHAISGNFDQAQMSIFLSGVVDAVVGGDPNGFGQAGTCVHPSDLRTGWNVLSGSFDYTGSGGAVLVNVNLQDALNGAWSILAIDAVHMEKVPTSVPEPGTASLFTAGLVALGFMRRRAIAA